MQNIFILIAVLTFLCSPLQTKAADAQKAAASSDGTIVKSPDQKIVDNQGDQWTLVKDPKRGLQIAVNGKIDDSTENVHFIIYNQGTVFQQATPNNLWWAWDKKTSTWIQTKTDRR